MTCLTIHQRIHKEIDRLKKIGDPFSPGDVAQKFKTTTKTVACCIRERTDLYLFKKCSATKRVYKGSLWAFGKKPDKDKMIQDAVWAQINNVGAVYTNDLMDATKVSREAITNWLKKHGFVKSSGHMSRRWVNAEYFPRARFEVPA